MPTSLERVPHFAVWMSIYFYLYSYLESLDCHFLQRMTRPEDADSLRIEKKSFRNFPKKYAKSIFVIPAYNHIFTQYYNFYSNVIPR